jgi:hypothetical protein
MNRAASLYSLGPWLVAALLMLVGLAGCGPRMVPVEGQVVFKDGKPLTGGVVSFDLLGAAAPGVAARGDIGPDGRFRLTTSTAGDGVPEGTYRVAVAPPLPARVDDLGKERIIPDKYLDPRTSGLEFTVTSGMNNFRIVMERP